MGKHDTMHRASQGWFEDLDGTEYYFCWVCGKETANLGTGVTPRHKGNVSNYKNGLKIRDRKNNVVAVVTGTSHRHSDW